MVEFGPFLYIYLEKRFNLEIKRNMLIIKTLIRLLVMGYLLGSILNRIFNPLWVLITLWIIQISGQLWMQSRTILKCVKWI